jgi:endonuclease/exonuclease/phosphatase family metal-dependent hydrolase
LPRFLCEENLILLGDFNCIVSEADALGRNGKLARRECSEGLKAVISAWNLKDVWVHFGKGSGFTRMDNRGSSRIDQIYVRQNLLTEVISVQNELVSFSDHIALVMDMGTNKNREKFIRNYRKLNPSILKGSLKEHELGCMILQMEQSQCNFGKS